MPRSHGVLKTEVWQAVSDFRRLTIDAQWAFAMLISQPQINNLGLLPYVPEKWCRLANDQDRDRLDQALRELEEHRYTVVDEATGELLVRTFIKHDAVWKQPRLVTNARRLIREVESPAIRDQLIERHPWLVDHAWTADKIAKHETRKRPPETPRETPQETPSDTPMDQEPLSEGLSPPRAHAQEGLGLPPGQDQPQEVEEEPPAAANAREPNKPAAAAEDLEQRLALIGLDCSSFDATTDPQLIRAWLDLAATEAQHNPAGFVLTGVRTGQPPSPRNGATPPVDYLERGRALYERTHDLERVADWLAGLTISMAERDRILEEIAA